MDTSKHSQEPPDLPPSEILEHSHMENEVYYFDKWNVWNKSITISLKCSLYSISAPVTHTDFDSHWNIEKKIKSDINFWIYMKSCVLTPPPIPTHMEELIGYKIYFRQIIDFNI